MKKIIFFFLIGLKTFGQEPVLESHVYDWDSLKVFERTQGQSRPILSQSNDKFKLIKAHISTVFPKKRMRPEAYRQENEELIIVKEGELTVTIEGKTKILKPGGIALIMSGDLRETYNAGEQNVSYYVFQWNSIASPDIERGKQHGGSLLINSDELPFQAHEKGGRRNFFNRPTSMCHTLELHTTSLHSGLQSHPPHTHRAGELIFVVSPQEAQAEEFIKDTWEKANVGDLIVLAPNELHTIRNIGQNTCTYFALQFE